MTRYEASPNLINQIQISLRNQSGLPSFSPSSPPPPSLLHDAISSLGSNPDNDNPTSRCEHCQGELLRGPHSLICIYCARAPPTHQQQPIPFKSTLAFRWFLSSLSLDGSEIVERPSREGSESFRRRNSVKDEEIPLSELLDFELKWPDELSGFGLLSEPGEISLSKLVGVDFDELIRSEGSGDGVGVSSKDQVVVSEESGDKKVAEFPTQSRLSLFENAGTLSGEVGNDDSFDWAAEFQSAEATADVDSLSRVESNFGSAELEKPVNVSVPASDFKQLEENILVKDGEKVSEAIDDASFNVLPAAGGQQKSRAGDPITDEKRDGADSLDDWDDFRMFTSVETNQGETSKADVCSGGLDVSDSWNDFTGAAHNQFQNNVDIMKPANGGGDDLGFFGHAGLGQQNSPLESSQNATSNQAESLGIWDGTSKEVDDSFDMWDFKSSVGEHNDRSRSTDTEKAENTVSTTDDSVSHLQNDFAVLNLGNREQEANNSKTVGVEINGSQDKSSGAWGDNSWGDFASSAGVSDNKLISNDTSSGGWGDFSTLMATSLNQSPSNETNSAGNPAVLDSDDALGLWGGFRNSGTQAESNFLGLNITESKPSNFSAGNAPENLSSIKDNDVNNLWGEFDWSTSISKQQSTSGGDDLFLGISSRDITSTTSPENPVNSSVRITAGDSASRNDDAFDTWGDFTSSNNVEANSWLSSTANVAINQEAVKDETVEEWNIIGSPPAKQASKDTTVPEDVDVIRTNFSSTNVKPEDVVSNSSLHVNPYFGIFGDQKIGREQEAYSQTVVPNSVSKEHASEAGDVSQPNKSETVAKELWDSKSSVVETLISEMHDLSFMLESSLSIRDSGT